MDKKVKEIKILKDLDKNTLDLLFDLYYNERHEWISNSEILFFINKSETNTHWKNIEIVLKSQKLFHDIRHILEENSVFNNENIDMKLYDSIINYDYFNITADKNNNDEYIAFTLKFKFPDFLNYKRINDILTALEASTDSGLMNQNTMKNIIYMVVMKIFSLQPFFILKQTTIK